MSNSEFPNDDLLEKLGYEDSESSDCKAKMEKIADDLQVERLPDEIDAGLHQEIEAIKQEAIKKREELQSAKRKKEKQEQLDRDAARGLGIGLSVAYTILGLPMAGLGIGYLLDKSLNSTAWVPVGVLTGSVLGVAMAIFMINKQQK